MAKHRMLAVQMRCRAHYITQTSASSHEPTLHLTACDLQVIKNWLPFVPGPAFAMLKVPLS